MEETQQAAEEPRKSSQKGISMIIAIVIIALLVVGGVVVYSMNKNNSSQMTDTMQPSPTEAMMHEESPTPDSSSSGEAMMEEGKTVAVEGANFKFNPTTITVKKGDKVTINFKSNGGFHDFVIDQFNARTEVVGSGKEDSITFTADKAGTFEYYCSVGNHRAMGMVGKLVVTP